MKEQLKEIKTLIKTNKTFRNIYIAIFILIIVLLASAIYLLSTSPSDDQARVAEVKITSEAFEPSTLTIRKGTEVIWTNANDNLHQIASNPHPTSDDLPTLVSEILNNEQTYEYTFSEVGTFGYHDKLNPTINGTIEVIE